MEDDLKTNEKMEDDLQKKWKTTSKSKMEDYLKKINNGKQPKKNKKLKGRR